MYKDFEDRKPVSKFDLTLCLVLGAKPELRVLAILEAIDQNRT